MYSDDDKHCRECLCATCDLWASDDYFLGVGFM